MKADVFLRSLIRWAGRLDGVWGYDVSLIDFAAGALIAQEGGALASNFNGDPKFLMENNIISATSKYINLF